MENHDICIYHDDWDGFAAAFCIWRQYEWAVDYYPFTHDKELDLDLVKNKNVYILDFSFDLATTLKIKELAQNLLIIDHHITAYRKLGDLSYFHYNPNMSASLATWKHFFWVKAPLLYEYIDDIDLWKKILANTDEVYYALDSYPRIFPEFDRLFKLGDKGIETLIKQGTIIKKYVDRKINNIINNNTTEISINNKKVKAINSPVWQSELGNRLATDYGQGLIYYDKDNITEYSLRSDGIVDVSETASKMGGGGHKAAAGFNTTCYKRQLFSADMEESQIEQALKHIDEQCLLKYKRGQFKYGPLNLDQDKRNFKQEAVEEYEDLLNYLKIGLLKLLNLKGE